MTSGAHVVPEHADARVHDEADEDRAFRSDASRNVAEQERKRETDELHDQDRSDEHRIREAELFAVGRGHLLDGLDSVVVDHECQQHQERLLVAAKGVERFAETYERSEEDMWPTNFIGLERPWRLRYTAKQRHRENHPPHRYRQESKACRQSPRRVGHIRTTR